MKKHFTLSLALALAIHVIAQDYQPIAETMASLRKAAAGPDRERQLDELFDDLTKKGSIPVIAHDSVLFLYRGQAGTVTMMGDFNGWGYDKTFKNVFLQIGNSGVWYLRAKFPVNARLDYKILVNGSEWIIDPGNTHQQWSGVGGGSPNSELRMPEWKIDPVAVRDPSVPEGKVDGDRLLTSKKLGYQITYSVYLPVGYDPSHSYKSVYVMDGYEYLHERLGNMKVILDNLIHQKKIEPIIAIFLDHREPVNRGNNKRMKELAMNPAYLDFITDEFIPEVESKYPISRNSQYRAILGSAMGGLTSAYFAFAKPGVFSMAGIQSPAFWFKPSIYTFCDNPENPPSKIFMITGVYNDAQEGALKMKDILERNTCTYRYIETNQGHSWGNWRDTIDDILVYFFPGK